MKKKELQSSDYAAYYKGYYAQLDEEAELMTLLEEGNAEFNSLLKDIPHDKLSFAYGETKWTVAEALIHIIDTERIFQYRALRFGRNDTTPIPGFEQDDYVPASNAAARDKESLLKEFLAVRSSTIALFASFNLDTLRLLGTASGVPMSVGAIGFLISAHQKHHSMIIRDRYL